MTTPAVAAFPALSVSDLEVRYGTAVAVSSLTLQVDKGAVVALLGVNGSGKSSFARACAGLVPPARGSVFFGQQDVTGWRADRIRRAGLVYLPEGRGIFPSLSVGENLRIAVSLAKPKAAALDRVLHLFPVLADRRRQLAGTLSGGEQQMLALARAFVGQPSVVIIDEPSLGLAPAMVDLTFESLAKAKNLGLTMVLIEQFVHRALTLADRCLILSRGSVSWQGTASEAAATDLHRHYLGGADPAS
jgi:branched-chain amino acid transport system ATP-binding protein